ncbi:MAG: sensor histidine kinase, partial [Armatimonadetes bacterium]|nr:sensor histidine kinase [Armatimonadota bacterium]
MFKEKKLIAGIMLRWLPLNLAALVLLLLWRAETWQNAAIVFLVNALSAFLVGEFIHRNRPLYLKAEQHPLDFTLQIANETLPYLRRGLNEETAAKTVEIIQKIADVAAVAIT